MAETAPPRTWTRTRSDSPGGTETLGDRMARCVRETRERWRVRAFEARLAERPDDGTVLTEFASYLETVGRRGEAAALYARLAIVHRKRRDVGEAVFCLRKLEHFGSPEATRIHRELAQLYAELGRFEEAARACRRVVSGYLAEGHVHAAVGFVRQLPALGSFEQSTRESILAEVERYKSARGATAGPAAGPVPGPAAGSEEPFLNGMLGRITPYDVVQIVEANGLTGRCDLQVSKGPAVVYFDGGRIVAARFGSATGRDALQQIFATTNVAFRVVVTAAVPEDEFRVASNTGLLLDVLRELDEERHEFEIAEDASA